MRFAIYSKDNYLHIYNRAVSKMKIFKNDHDYRFFLYLLSKYKFKYKIKIEESCVMPNHFHLLIKCPKNPKRISKFMQCIQQSYARYFNREYDHEGHVFQGEYKFSVIFTPSSLKRVKEYIKQNPVKDGLVEEAKDWPYRL